MQEDNTNPINLIRTVNRSKLKDMRSKHKELILCNKRLRLQEVSEYVHDVTISEFKDLLLKLKPKLKNIPVAVLKKIKNSCVNYEYIEALFRNGEALNSLVRILIGNDARKQLEAAACLTNLACGPHKCSFKVAKASGVYLIAFLDGGSYLLQEQCAWALANIANDCSKCFDIIKSQGVMPALLKLLVSPLPNVVQSVMFALNACTKYEDPEIVSVIQNDFTNHLLSLLEQHDINETVFLDTAFTFSHCCYLSIKYNLNIFEAKNVERIINILQKIVLQGPETEIQVALPIIRSLGFLSCDDQISLYLSSHSDFYKSIYTIASAEGNVHVFKEIVWVLSNITASTDVICNLSDLKSWLDKFKVILKQEKSVTLQVLYYLTVLLSKHKFLNFQLVHHEISEDIKSLLESEDKDVSEASRVFLEILEQS